MWRSSMEPNALTMDENSCVPGVGGESVDGLQASGCSICLESNYDLAEMPCCHRDGSTLDV